MSELTLKAIQKEKDKWLKSYKDNYASAISFYNREKELMRAYNGRQVLEIIQNADDAKAKSISFHLDKERKFLTVSNDGEPFSLEGIKSIMVPDLSSKTDQSYIGNKGLGFRSILNWADEISIISSGLRISFSNAIVKETVTQLNWDLEAIRAERNMSGDYIPLPILGVPDIQESNSSDRDNGCVFRIHYLAKFETDIELQLKSVSETSLLFLRNVTTIFIDNIKLSIDRSREKPVAAGTTWSLHSTEGTLEEQYQDPTKKEKRRYGITIAVPDTFVENCGVIFNYLPTQEKTGLPFILHATLDLEMARNHINESPVNRHILGKAADFIAKVAQEHFKRSNADWKAYLMMSPNLSMGSTIVKEALFNRLTDIRDNSEVLPTISGSYVSKDDYFFYSDKDSQFWRDMDIDGRSRLGKILLPRCEEDKYSLPIAIKRIDEEKLKDDISYLSNSIVDLVKRVDLIQHLFTNKNALFTNQQNDRLDLPLMVDGDRRLIQRGHCFLPKKSNDQDFVIPSFVNMNFADKDLSEMLSERFQEELKSEKDQSDRTETEDRVLSRLLRGIVSFSEYDKAAVARFIVSDTNAHLETIADEDRIQCIKDMVASLFELRMETNLDSVKLVNENNDIVPAKSLLLPSKTNKEIFNDSNVFVQGSAYWGIEDIEFDKFMKHLGVNQWVGNSFLNKWEYKSKYFVHIESCCEIVHKNNQTANTLYFSSPVKYLRNSELLSKLSPVNLVKLISTEPDILDALRSSETLHFYYNRRDYPLNTQHNYLRFQLQLLPNVIGNFICGEILSRGESMKHSYGLTEAEYEIKDKLSTELHFISEEKKLEILNKLKENNIDRIVARKVYRLFYDHYTTAPSHSLSSIGELFLLCSDGEYRKTQEIYYSGTINIPHKVIEKVGLHRFSYPTRQSEERICGVFGLTPASSICIDLKEYSVNTLNKEFNAYVSRIKPYVLFYALKGVNDATTKKSIAELLNRSKIVLVESCIYSISVGQRPAQLEQLNENEFLYANNTYYILSSKCNFAYLKSSSTFCKSVAEMMTSILKLENRNDAFIHLFKDFDFAREIVSDQDISECNELLGLSQDERVFWTAIAPLLGFTKNDLDSPSFREQVAKKLSMDEDSIKLVDYTRWNTDYSLSLVYNLISIAPDKKDMILGCVDLSAHHKKALDSVRLNNGKVFKSILWHHYQNVKEEQHNFISTLNKFYSIEFPTDRYKHIIDIDYNAIVRDYIKEVFNLDMATEAIDHEFKGNFYTDLVPDENEIDDEAVRSLLYFEGNKEYIEIFVKEFNERKASFSESTTPDQTDDDIIVNIHNAEKTIDKASNLNIISSRKKKRGGIHRKSDDERNYKAGENAERTVKKYLEKEGYAYLWCSGYSDEPGKDDTLGYDFTYSKEGIERRLEVKSSSDNTFILSANEYRVALTNPDIYDIAIVNGKQIDIYLAFFNGKYSEHVRDRIISFEKKREDHQP